MPERKTYKPGDTARIMIQSPWEQATALVTTEREGIRIHRQFALTSTQQSIDVPITEDDIPNVFVSVLLVKGRTHARPPRGRRGAKARRPTPAIRASRRSGSATSQLERRGRSKRLTVAVTANKEEYRPANAANVTPRRRRIGRARRRERGHAVGGGLRRAVADRLTARPTCSARSTCEKALQVLNETTASGIVSRRVLTPKGDTDGGGGGADAAAGTVRQDFRVLAFWLGSVTTDASGHALGGRQAARVADHLSDHGGRGGS